MFLYVDCVIDFVTVGVVVCVVCLFGSSRVAV